MNILRISISSFTTFKVVQSTKLYRRVFEMPIGPSYLHGACDCDLCERVQHTNPVSYPEANLQIYRDVTFTLSHDVERFQRNLLGAYTHRLQTLQIVETRHDVIKRRQGASKLRDTGTAWRGRQKGNETESRPESVFHKRAAGRAGQKSTRRIKGVMYGHERWRNPELSVFTRRVNV